MSDRDDPAGAGAEAAKSELSPYRPPTVVDEDSNQRPALVLKSPISVAAIAGYAFAATLLSVFLFFALETVLNAIHAPFATVVALILAIPMLLVGFFCGRAISITGSELPKATKSLSWKLRLILVAAPVSLVVFVPTCIAASIAITMIAGRDAWPSGVFAAYFVTFYLVAVSVRSRMTSGVTQFD